MKYAHRYNAEIAKLLKEGHIGVAPTDTLYGLLAVASNQAAVERVYALKGRRADKPLIILIDDAIRLLDYGIDKSYVDRAKAYWPAPITLVLPVGSAPDYLTRGGGSLAFRMPGLVALRKLIRSCGALVAPSANPEGKEPASSIKQARQYFGDQVDFYVGSNQPISASASTILKLTDDCVEQIR